MTFKLAGVVLFLIALQAVPLLTFVHAHPTESINNLNNKLDASSHEAMTQILTPGKINGEIADYPDNTQRF